MKKTSTKKHLKRTVILASLIFGSLLLIACPGPFVNSGNTDNTAQGSGDGNGNQQISNFLEEFKNLSENEQNHLISSINNDINVLKSNNIKLEYTDGKFSLSLPDKLTYSVTPIIEENADSSEALGINLIETYKKKNNEEKAKRETLSKDNIKTSIDGYSVPSNLKNKITKVDDLKTDIKNLVDNNDTSKITLEASYGDADLSKLYLKMSDLDSSILPEATEDGATVIPGVKRIMKNGRTALDFTQLANADIKIDFDKNVDITSALYKGGLLFPKTEGASVELLNQKDKKISADIWISDFKDSTSNSIFNYISKITDDDLPILSSFWPIGTTTENNIYNTEIETIIKKYYNLTSKVESGSQKGIILDALEYDAKDVLNGTSSKRMFDDSGNLNSDISSNQSLQDKISINPEFASYLIKNGVNLKNVIIKEGTWTSNGLGTIVNSVVNADMSGVDKVYVKGLVRFNGKSPKDFRTETTAKIILTQFDESMSYHRGINLMYDISNLGDNQNTIINDKNTANIFYLSSDKESLFDKLYTGIDFAQAYIIYDKNTNTAKYKANSGNIKEYSNKALEDWGNSDVSPSPINLKEGTGTIDYNNSMSTLSRANNIKLTPVQKLLLDDQHIYG